LSEASVGPYRILEKLGSGGMGDVYLAEDARLHRRVALKTLAGPGSQAAGARQRLLREARAAARLNHPNIAAIYDVIETDDSAHIVMEYVEGEALSDRLARGPLPPDQVADLAFQLCDAIAAAHAQAVIHGDLKPGNVLLTRDGKAKVLDFGLAKAPSGPGPVAGGEPTLDADGHLLGTPAYMAPEQLRREKVDQRTDLYSLGVMLFELLTAQRPFKGDGVLQLGLAILNDPTPTPQEALPAVPAALSAIVSRAMAREPADRFQSAVEMREALRRLPARLSEAPTLSGAFPWDRTTRKARRFDRSPRWRMAALAVVLALAGTLAYRQRPRPDRTGVHPVVAVLPLANLGGAPEDDYLGVGIADALVTHLAGLPSLTVVSRSATQASQGRRPGTRQLAQDLGLSYVVSGSVQRAERRLRVTLQLVRPDESVAWGRDYEGTLDELFRLQRDAAQGLAGALSPGSSPAAGEPSRPPSGDLEAFAQYARGRALLERPDVAGNVAKAIEAFEDAVRRDSGFALAHAALGEALWARYQETGDAAFTVKARDAVVEALRLDPEQGATRYTLALIYHGTGRAEPAIAELRRVVSLHPGNDDASRLLGNILADLGRWEEAEGALRRAVGQRPGYWGNHAALGHLFYRTGRHANAIAEFRIVTQLQPDNSRGHQMLGAAYQAAGQESQALASYQKALEQAPDARAWSNIGVIRYGQGRFEEAARAWEEAARLEPREPLKHRNLGDAYARLERVEDARRAWERAVALAAERLKVNPQDAASLSMQAVCEAKLGRRGDARRHAAAAVALAPDDADALYESTLVHALIGEPERALSTLEQALKRGYSPSLARSDEDLAPLRSLAGYRALFAER
jgi:tetratricopeptide (TPR) repeat protein